MKENPRATDPAHYPPKRKENYSFEEVTEACREVVRIMNNHDNHYNTTESSMLRRLVGHVLWRKLHYSN